MKNLTRSSLTVASVLLLALTTSAVHAQEPPSQIQEDWFDHTQLLDRVFYNDEVGIYFDPDANRDYTWMNQYLTDAWRYTKDTYGDFGEEGTDESRLYAVFHEGRHGGGHPGTYFDSRHGFRNIVDVGAGPWASMSGTPLDLLTHEIAHIVEGASRGIHGSPQFDLWGDSKWAEIYIYDVYDGLGMTVERDRWYGEMIASTDDIPVPGVNWFRDFWFPLYSDYGGSQILADYFTVLSENYPTVPREYDGNQGISYANDMNWGEFIHFWGGAAGVDVSDLATSAFGWNGDYERQFRQAQRDYPLPYHEGSDPGVDTLDQIALFADCAFGGDTAYIGVGNYLLGELNGRGLQNDALSSIQVAEGYTVTLYSDDNYQGRFIKLTADDDCLDDNDFDDDVSSIQVGLTSDEEESDGDITNDGGALTSSDAVDPPANEGLEKLTDDDINTKFLSRSNRVSIVYQANDAYVLGRYTLASAGDAPGRDPGTWTLSGSNDGVDYVALDTRTDETFAERLEQRTFDVTTDEAYSYFKLDVAATDSALNLIQIAEWEMFSADSTLSTRRVVDAKSLQVFPNPTAQTLTVQLPDALGVVDFRVLDISGKVVARGRTSGNIDVSHLADGVYVLSLLSEYKEFTTRFVKK